MTDNPAIHNNVHNIISPLHGAIAAATGIALATVENAPCEVEWSSSNHNNWDYALFLPNLTTVEIWHEGPGGFDVDPLEFRVVDARVSAWSHPDVRPDEIAPDDVKPVPGMERIDNRYCSTCHFHAEDLIEIVRKVHLVAGRAEWLFHQLQEGREIAAGALAHVETDLREVVADLIAKPST